MFLSTRLAWNIWIAVDCILRPYDRPSSNLSNADRDVLDWSLAVAKL